MRVTIMLAMLALTGSMAAVLLGDECSVAYGASPLAWGLLTWWSVDTAARVTLWPLRDRKRLRKVAMTYRNLSNLLLLACAAPPGAPQPCRARSHALSSPQQSGWHHSSLTTFATRSKLSTGTIVVQMMAAVTAAASKSKFPVPM